jgi:hypothetical protein
MTDSEVDRILSSAEEDILPSAGFVGSVMESIRSEATTPPSIPFPWRLALAGVLAGIFAVVWFFMVAGRYHAASTSPVLSTLTLTPVIKAIACAILVPLVSLACLILSSQTWSPDRAN